MSEDINVIAEPREAGSSNAARRLRGEGRLPANISRVDSTATSIQLDAHTFDLMLRKYGESALIDIDLSGKTIKALIKDVQVDPITDALVHIDFAEVDMKATIRLTIPIELVGESRGVAQGGSLSKLIREVEIECLPADLPEALEINISDMDIDSTLFVKDVDLGDKVTILTSEDVLIVTVSAPRVSGKTADDGAEGEAGAEGAEGADGDEGGEGEG